jgi:hypothetical protein
VLLFQGTQLRKHSQTLWLCNPTTPWSEKVSQETILLWALLPQVSASKPLSCCPVTSTVTSYLGLYHPWKCSMLPRFIVTQLLLFLVLLGFACRALCLLGRHSSTWAMLQWNSFSILSKSKVRCLCTTNAQYNRRNAVCRDQLMLMYGWQRACHILHLEDTSQIIPHCCDS